MNGVRLAKRCSHLIHALHLTAGLAAFYLLLDIESRITRSGHLTWNLQIALHEDEFSFHHHGFYLLMISVLLLAAYLRRSHLSRHLNLKLDWEVTDLEVKEVQELSHEEVFAGKGYTLHFEKVTKRTFEQFLNAIETAFPSGTVSPMSKEERHDFYLRWLKSGAASMALITKTGPRNQPKRIVGFMAACQVKHHYFSRLVRGELQGLDVSRDDLGTDPDGLCFIDIRHWYIKHSEAEPKAMIWAIGRTLRELVIPGTKPTVYGHTVTTIGAHNYKVLGFRNYGQTPHHHNPQFVLDSRGDLNELSQSARWTVQSLLAVDDLEVPELVNRNNAVIEASRS